MMDLYCRVGGKPSGAAVVLCALLASGADAETFVFLNSYVQSTPASVQLVGSFNGWDTSVSPMPGTADGFAQDVALGDGEHEYKFLVTLDDDSTLWLTDRTNPVYNVDVEGNVNSLIKLESGSRVIPDNVESFGFLHPLAQEIILAGDFNWWRESEIFLEKEGDEFQCWVRTPRPLSYKFIVDGIWGNEPAKEDIGTVIDGYGGYNNVRLPVSISAKETGDQQVTLAPRAEKTSALIYDGQSPEEAIALSKQSVREGDYDTAMKICKNALMASGKTVEPNLTYREAEIERRFGNVDRAAQAHKRLIDEYPKDERARIAYHELARYRIYQENDYAGARELYEDLLEVKSIDKLEKAKVYREIAYCYRRDQNWTEAEKYIKKAKSAAPAFKKKDKENCHFWVELHMLEGICELYSGKENQARKTFEKVLEISPDLKEQNAQFAQNWLDFMDRQAAEKAANKTPEKQVQ